MPIDAGVWKLGCFAGAAVWLVLLLLAASWARSSNREVFRLLGEPVVLPTAIGTLRFLYGFGRLGLSGALSVVKWVMALWLPALLLWMFSPVLRLMVLE